MRNPQPDGCDKPSPKRVVRDSFVPLFYYFRLEGQVLETHLLRLIDKYVDFGFDDQTESVKGSCTVSFPFEMQQGRSRSGMQPLSISMI
jgi:hypothetical protein